VTKETPSDRVSQPALGSTAKAALKLSPAIIAGWVIGARWVISSTADLARK